MNIFFSTNLKFLRESKKLSQNKLAEMIGVNQTTIARWEDDNRTPNLDNAIDVSVVFHISLADLLGRDLRLGGKPIIEDEYLTSLENALKDKGILNKDDEMSKEDYDKIMNFVEVNKNLLLNKDKKK